MEKMRYKKTRGKQTNYFKIDWDPSREALVAKVTTKDKVFSPILMSKDPSNNWQLCAQPDKRVTTVVNYSRSILILAKKVILLNESVTRENALDSILSVMTNDELLVDWKKGYAYYKNGRTTFRRTSIEAHYLVDKTKIIKWNAADHATIGGEDGEIDEQD